MSSWKRPHVALTCADCHSTFDGLAETRCCSECRYKPANRKYKKKKYDWTPERERILRERYDSTVRGRADEIARSLGWPAWVIKKHARKLGLGTPWPQGRTSRLTWSESDVAFLLDHVGQRTPLWIAKRLGKSETSIVLKIKRLNLSRRIDDGRYTLKQVCEGFGVDHHVIERWISRGWLEVKRRGLKDYNDHFAIAPDAIKRFICDHPTAFELRKVDQLWFLEIIGVLAHAIPKADAA